MKKLVLANIQEGVRKLGSVKAFFEHIENSYFEVFNDIVFGLVGSTNGPIALYGCVNSGVGSDYTINAGAIYLNGEIFKIPSFSGTAPGGQVPILVLNQVFTQLAYTDNTNQNTLVNRTLMWAFGVSGSGLADFSAVASLKQCINNNLLDVPGQINVKNKVVPIGDWDMDTTGSLPVPHGLTDVTKIRSISVMIRPDSGEIPLYLISKLDSIDPSTLAIQGGVYRIGSTNIELVRLTGGQFDAAAYNATSYNRGWITIFYES